MRNIILICSVLVVTVVMYRTVRAEDQQTVPDTTQTIDVVINSESPDFRYQTKPLYGIPYSMPDDTDIATSLFATLNTVDCATFSDGTTDVVGPQTAGVVNAYQDYNDLCSGLGAEDCAGKYSARTRYSFLYKGIGTTSTIQVPYVWWSGAEVKTLLPPRATASSPTGLGFNIWGLRLFFDPTSVRPPDSTHDDYSWNLQRWLNTNPLANWNDVCATCNSVTIPQTLIPYGKVGDVVVQVDIPARWKNQLKPYITTCNVQGADDPVEGTAIVRATQTRQAALTRTVANYPTVAATVTPYTVQTRTAIAATPRPPGTGYNTNLMGAGVWQQVINGQHIGVYVSCTSYDNKNCGAFVERTAPMATTRSFGMRFWNATKGQGYDAICSSVMPYCGYTYYAMNWAPKDFVQVKCISDPKVHCGSVIWTSPYMITGAWGEGTGLNFAATATAYYSQSSPTVVQATPTGWVVNTLVPFTAVPTTSSASTMTRAAQLGATQTAKVNTTRVAGTATRAVALTSVALTATAVAVPTNQIQFTQTRAAELAATEYVRSTQQANITQVARTALADDLSRDTSDLREFTNLKETTDKTSVAVAFQFLFSFLTDVIQNKSGVSCTNVVNPWSAIPDKWDFWLPYITGLCKLHAFFLSWSATPYINSLSTFFIFIAFCSGVYYWLQRRGL